MKNGAGELVVNSIGHRRREKRLRPGNAGRHGQAGERAHHCLRRQQAAKEDFAELFRHPGMDAGLAASIFHTRQVEIRALKGVLRAQGVEMRL